MWLKYQNLPVGEEKMMCTLAPGPLWHITIWQAYDINGFMLALIKCRFHAPTCQVNAWNNHVLTLSTNLVPRF
jgi:hypothetical protein